MSSGAKEQIALILKLLKEMNSPIALTKELSPKRVSRMRAREFLTARAPSWPRVRRRSPLRLRAATPRAGRMEDSQEELFPALATSGIRLD